MRLRRTSTVRRLAALIAVTALTWVSAPSAVAGGPTSVLITSPESAETAALYNSHVEYEALSTQLGGEGMGALPEGRKKRPASLDSATGSRRINVTWMAHDAYPWRLDEVYPSDDTSRIWIHTSRDTRRSDTGVWHQAKDPAALRALLKSIGVMGEKTQPGADVIAAPAAEKEARGSDEAAGVSSGGADGRWWAIPALGVGVVLGLVLRPLAGRLPRPPYRRGGRRPEGGPRRQLLDV